MAPHRALDLPLQELVYAGLQALLAVTDLDVCAYLHDSVDTGPQLFLGTPTLAAAKGPEASSLLADLSAVLQRAHGELPGGVAIGEERIAGVPCTVVTTAGPEGRGVHALGRRTPEVPDATRLALVRLATALGGAVHRLQWAASAGAGATTPAR
jgi:hypothetical protein